MAHKISLLITDEIIIACPSLLRYASPPDDQPGCELESCPHCDRKMWVYTKKRTYRDNLPKENYFIGCYECIEDYAKREPETFSKAPMVNI